MQGMTPAKSGGRAQILTDERPEHAAQRTQSSGSPMTIANSRRPDTLAKKDGRKP